MQIQGYDHEVRVTSNYIDGIWDAIFPDHLLENFINRSKEAPVSLSTCYRHKD